MLAPGGLVERDAEVVGVDQAQVDAGVARLAISELVRRGRARAG